MGSPSVGHQGTEMNNSHPEKTPLVVETKNDSRRPRLSSFVNISERNDFNIIAAREAFTSDLDVYDAYLHQLKQQDRTEPFHKELWLYVRQTLEVAATPTGFDELPHPKDCQVKTKEDVLKITQKAIQLTHLLPISPHVLAEMVGCSLQSVLTELFYATKIGLVDMVWSPDCVQCGGSVCQKHNLSDLPTNEAHCQACGYKNKLEYLDTVKVFFILNPQVLYVPTTSLECAHSKARMSQIFFVGIAFPTSTKSGFSYEFGDTPPPLKQGTYRIFCPFSTADCYLRVEADATEQDESIVATLKVSQLLKDNNNQRTVLTIPHGKVRFDMFCDTYSIFTPQFLNDMEDRDMFAVPPEERKPYTSATTCIHHALFRKMFEKQVVSDMSSFTIQRVVLVFTDVVGSTALYESCGDGVALRAVKEHFKVLFTAFRLGRVVKTVGDCVMAAFTSGQAAIEAVAAGLEGMQQHCVLPDGTPLAIRVGMHCGPTLMVALNGINDYFGSTVNVAARVESKAAAHECLITDAVLSDPGAAVAYEELLSNNTSFVHSRDVELSLKGVDNLVQAKGFKLHDSAVSA